jgi:hypothetical protein
VRWIAAAMLAGALILTGCGDNNRQRKDSCQSSTRQQTYQKQETNQIGSRLQQPQEASILSANPVLMVAATIVAPEAPKVSEEVAQTDSTPALELDSAAMEEEIELVFEAAVPADEVAEVAPVLLEGSIAQATDTMDPQPMQQQQQQIIVTNGGNNSAGCCYRPGMPSWPTTNICQPDGCCPYVPCYWEPNMSVFLRHTEAGGIGYDDGYSTFGLFFTPTFINSPRIFPLVDGRFHAFNEGGLAANAGVGVRFMSSGYGNVFGANFFWDWRAKHHHQWHRGGVGLEWLTCSWDLRANGYFGIGPDKFCRHTKKFHFPGGYKADCTECYHALPGADLEIGFPLKRWDCCSTSIFYLAAGPYYYRSEGSCNRNKHENIWGGQGRLQVQYLNYLIFEVKDSYDNFYHNNFQGSLTFKVPFGNQKEPYYRAGCGSCCTYDCARPIAVQPIVRHEIPVFQKEEHWNNNWGCGFEPCD